MKLERRELPPAETKGRVTPTMGTIPIFIPILTKIWIKKEKNITTEKILQNLSSDLTKIVYILYKKKTKQISTINDPISPSCSAIVAKIKSVCLSGRNLNPDCVPCPSPLPIIIPDPTAIMDWITLYEVPKGSLEGLRNVRTLCLW